MNYVRSNSQGLKYRRFTTSGCKDIKQIKSNLVYHSFVNRDTSRQNRFTAR